MKDKKLKHEILISNGEIKFPGLVKRSRVYADLDYESSTVQQHFKDECDINNIVKRYAKEGRLHELMASDDSYRDFSDVPTFQEAQNIVAKAQAQFEALPSDLRDRFSNDPAKFLKFATDPKNVEDMIKLGLATKVEPPQPTELEKLTNELKTQNQLISKKISDLKKDLPST